MAEELDHQTRGVDLWPLLNVANASRTDQRLHRIIREHLDSRALTLPAAREPDCVLRRSGDILVHTADVLSGLAELFASDDYYKKHTRPTVVMTALKGDISSLPEVLQEDFEKLEEMQEQCRHLAARLNAMWPGGATARMLPLPPKEDAQHTALARADTFPHYEMVQEGAPECELADLTKQALVWFCEPEGRSQGPCRLECFYGKYCMAPGGKDVHGQLTKFSTNTELCQHLKRHIRPYACPIPQCYAAYNSMANLKVHFTSNHIPPPARPGTSSRSTL